MTNLSYAETPIGRVGVAEEDGAITSIFLAGADAPEEHESALTREAHRQLSEYFEGKRRAFVLPVAPKGTDFQRAVWAELCRIPCGQTRTYGQIAQAVGNPKGARAVGMACNRNPILIAIPCHRVVGADGSLTGYACGLDVKRRLLELEA